MASTRRLFPVLILFLTLPIVAWGQQIEESDDGYTARVTKTFSVASGGQLNLDATNGSITVSGGDRSEVVVNEKIRFEDSSREDVSEYLEEHPTVYEASDGTVRIRGPERNNGGWWDGPGVDVEYSYTVKLPRQFNANVETSGGSLTVTDLNGTVQGQTAGGSVTARRITGDVQVETAGGSLTLEELDGAVQGKTAGGSIDVSAISGPLNVRTAGGSIRITDVRNNVSAKTAGGSIRVTSVEGSVDARTSGGDVIVESVSKSVDAKTAGGDIELRDLGARVTAETSGGDVEGVNLRGRVEARTSAGDVDLRNVSAPVRAETSVGDVGVELTASDLTADPVLDLTTSHGDIHVALPTGLQASIRAEVDGFGRGPADDEIRSDVPLTREGGDGDPLRATGEMNGGGPSILLETTGGSIRIRTGESGS